ncbi:MAG: hypothetical protein BMS9Abin28_0001 [Anaerolineae bacterium]|nr:MAG: hypothetical protein BMS9Abin28_0001 [Anaerolineae bacterium]
MVIEGLLLGSAGLIVSQLTAPSLIGRSLADPLPLALVPAAVMRSVREGFAYFDLSSPLLHLIFAIGLGAGAAWLTVRRGGTAEQARPTARIASGLSILVVAVQEVDAVIVAFYYGLSAFVSLSISAYAADRVARQLFRRQAAAIRQLGKNE